MQAIDPSDTVVLIQRLRQEVAQLTEQQSKALKGAVYVGMTADEAEEYDERRQQITRIISQLMMLEQAR